ncbi:MFS transporter [Longispora sp. NPDC051575]|uniref:MFS transporter n=1 Tax=Longispora sp. NPDC051575 TaxID=3154943 RepID=UPI0034158199
MITNVIGGVGVAIGIAVGALLTARLTGGPGLSGLAQSGAVVGGALMAIPMTRLMNRSGRRPGLLLGYAVGALGALLVVAAAVTESGPLAFLGMFCFGGSTAANLQARYAAVDLAEPARRGWQLSIVVWATTIGSVAGPNLSRPADALLRKAWADLPELAGPFVFSALAFAVAGLLIWGLLRPDPLVVARGLAAAQDAGAAPAGPVAGSAPGGPAAGSAPGADGSGRGGVVTAEPRFGMRSAFRLVMEIPAARLGLAATAVGHLVMVGVMSMTPIYIGQTPGIDHGDVLSIVGLVLSLHIAGMYALSPLVGLATDRFGRRPVILTGLGLLLAACAIAGTADHGTPQLAAGLFTLGLGWSCTMIGGSTLLVESVPVTRRPAAQGLSDLVMGLSGAGAGALGGVVVQVAGFPVLAVLAAACAVPVLALALRVRSAVRVGG